jgi:hypothetical protein
MARQDATGQRAARLVDTLRGRREQGDDAYPLTVARLRELAEPDAADPDVFKALAKKPFAQQIVVAGKKDPASPIALAEYAAALAASPLPPAVRQRVEALSPEELRQLTLDFVKAQSLKDLRLAE